MLRQEAGKALARFLCRRKQPLAFSVESKGAGRLSACALLIARQSRKAVKPPLGGFPGCIASGGGQSFHSRAQTAMSGGPMGFIKHPPVEHGKRPCGRNLHGRCIGQRRWCGRCAHFYKGTVLCMLKGPCPANAKKMELAFCTFPQNGRTGPRILSCVQSALRLCGWL